MANVGIGRLAMTSIGALVAAGAAHAQQAEQPAQSATAEVPDIVVTAQKRSEPLQRVPLAITAIGGDTLDRSGIRTIGDIQAVVPNLNLGPQLGVAKVALRGIGLESIAAGAEGSIALHVDGVFVSRSVVALSSFFDLERVEVLRGPQGTLYGRNATGGSINLITRAPTEDLSGYFNVLGGNYGHVLTEGALSGALIPGKVQARIAYQTEDRDGFGRNIVTGNSVDNLHQQSVRGQVVITPVDPLRIELTADYHREHDRSGGYHFLGGAGFSAPGVPIVPYGAAFGGAIPTNTRDIANNQDPSNRTDFWGVRGRVSYDFGTVQLSSLTAYRKTNYVIDSDLDSTGFQLAPIEQSEHARQFSEEVQLSGIASRLKWLIGFYYFNEVNDGGISVPLNDIIFGGPGVLRQGYFAGGRIKTDALAVFGQASYELVDHLQLTLGARYSSELKRVDEVAQFDLARPYDPANPLSPLGTQVDRRRFNSFTPRVGLDYQLTPRTLLYAAWSRGFKAGTYNLGSLTPPVRPEKVDAYEAGAKIGFAKNGGHFNLAGFYYDYSDLQVGKVLGQTLVLENAATATIYGLEAELIGRPVPRVEVNLNGSWLHARFDRYISADPARAYGDGHTVDPDTGQPAFNLAGNRLSQSPDFTAFGGAEYTLPTPVGEFRLRGEVAWTDRVYFTPFNVAAVSQGPKTKINATLTYEHRDGHFSAQLFVRNLLDKTYVGNAYISSALVGFPINGYLEEPRSFGIKLGYKL